MKNDFKMEPLRDSIELKQYNMTLMKCEYFNIFIVAFTSLTLKNHNTKGRISEKDSYNRKNVC